MTRPYRASNDPALVSAALAEVADHLRSQKYEAYALTCDYARQMLAPLIALDDNGFSIARLVPPSANGPEVTQ